MESLVPDTNSIASATAPDTTVLPSRTKLLHRSKPALPTVSPTNWFTVQLSTRAYPKAHLQHPATQQCTVWGQHPSFQLPCYLQNHKRQYCRNYLWQKILPTAKKPKPNTCPCKLLHGHLGPVGISDDGEVLLPHRTAAWAVLTAEVNPNRKEANSHLKGFSWKQARRDVENKQSHASVVNIVRA